VKRFVPLLLADACGVAVCWVYREPDRARPKSPPTFEIADAEQLNVERPGNESVILDVVQIYDSAGEYRVTRGPAEAGAWRIVIRCKGSNFHIYANPAR
jgi:hypothetical protein